MEPLRPLFWGQGMLLQPQHFQQQDNYHDGRLHHFLRLFSPLCWGIHSLAVNEPGLRNFVFEIEQGEVLTFDGTLLRLGGEGGPGTARAAARSFEHELDPGGKPLSVYLGVRRLQPHEGNLGGVDGTRGEPGSRRRFVLEEAEVADLFAGDDNPCRLQYLVHDAEILFDVSAERSQDYELVKLAEILRSADGKGGTLSRQYVAPCITVRSSPVLAAMLKEIRDQLTAKGREIGAYARRGKDGVELGARDLGRLLMIQTLNRHIPLFHHHLELGDSHPEVLYALLRQLTGELSSFSTTISVLGARDGDDGVPPYQHNELWRCFSQAIGRVRELLDELTTTPVGDVLLKHDGECFTADLDQQFLTGDNRYYLAIRSDLSPAQLYRLLQETGKITSRDDLPKLQKSFLFGLKLDVLESPPEELVARAHYRYFLIDQHSEHWQKIRQQRNIAVASTALAPDTEMRLLAIWGK
ncbi:MAG: type VI secretion system baseplate subunit TssK [Candidatus Binataceae bacterium]